MSQSRSRLEALKANNKKTVPVETESAAELMVGNATTTTIKVVEENDEMKAVVVEESPKEVVETPVAETKRETEDKPLEAPKSKVGRKPTRSETMVKFSYKVPKNLADTVKADLLRKGKKVQPVLTKLIEEWVSNPTELNIDQAYTSVPTKQMKSTGFYIEKELVNEFGAVTIEQDTSMNLVVIYLYNQIVRGNY